MPSVKRLRGLCPGCKMTRAITHDGRLHGHHLRIVDATTQLVARQRCAGSGQVAADWTDLDTAPIPEGYWAGFYDARKAVHNGGFLQAVKLLDSLMETHDGVPQLQETTT